MTFFHAAVEESLQVRVPPPLASAVEEYRKIYEAYDPADARYLRLHQGHFMWVRPEEERFLTAELLRS